MEDTGDVYFVPAFSGLFAPHWRSDARGCVAVCVCVRVCVFAPHWRSDARGCVAVCVCVYCVCVCATLLKPLKRTLQKRTPLYKEHLVLPHTNTLVYCTNSDYKTLSMCPKVSLSLCNVSFSSTVICQTRDRTDTLHHQSPSL